MNCVEKNEFILSMIAKFSDIIIAIMSDFNYYMVVLEGTSLHYMKVKLVHY